MEGGAVRPETAPPRQKISSTRLQCAIHIIQSAVSKMLIKLLSLFTTINYAERLTFSEYENANPLEIMTQRAQKLKKYCGSQKVGFRMNKNAKVTVKGKLTFKLKLHHIL